MRVLYLLANYPQYSESYIDAEIHYARSQGIEVGVWSSVSGYGDRLDGVPTLYGQYPMDAIADFKPDLLHIHYLVTAQQVLKQLFTSLPITVRAHSFDWSVGRALEVHTNKNVEAIYAFPHFAREFPSNEKVVPLPVAFDGSLYDGPMMEPADPNRVIRLAAGRRMKGLEDFFTVAWSLFPSGSFHMAVSRIRGDEGYVERTVEAGMKTGVTVFTDLPRSAAVRMIRTAGIYLDTSDPSGHPFGMPISVAEAFAAGAVVIMRDSPAAREYGGEVALYYSTLNEAKILVDHALRIGIEQRIELMVRGIARSEMFRSDVVLPRLVEDWKRFVQENREKKS